MYAALGTPGETFCFAIQNIVGVIAGLASPTPRLYLENCSKQRSGTTGYPPPRYPPRVHVPPPPRLRLCVSVSSA